MRDKDICDVISAPLNGTGKLVAYIRYEMNKGKSLGGRKINVTHFENTIILIDKEQAYLDSIPF